MASQRGITQQETIHPTSGKLYAELCGREKEGAQIVNLELSWRDGGGSN